MLQDGFYEESNSISEDEELLYQDNYRLWNKMANICEKEENRTLVTYASAPPTDCVKKEFEERKKKPDNINKKLFNCFLC